MKTFKIILLSTAAFALLTITGINIHLNKTGASKYSDVTLKNIEALSDEGSNNQGYGNQFYYEHLIGDPKFCTLYKHVSASGSVSYNGEEAAAAGEISVTKDEGLHDSCKNGSGGCTAYSCQKSNPNN